jgi:hypothetical protein
MSGLARLQIFQVLLVQGLCHLTVPCGVLRRACLKLQDRPQIGLVSLSMQCGPHPTHPGWKEIAGPTILAEMI